MSFQQKIAWLNLVVAAAAASSYLALWPLIGPWRAMGAFGLLGFAGVSGILYWREARPGHVVADERDQLISLKSMAIAKSVIWVGLIVAFVVALQSIGDDGTVSVRGLAMVVWWAICLFSWCCPSPRWSCIESNSSMSKSGLSNEIRRLRFEHGQMTQEQLAERVAVTRQTIIALESGRYAPSLPLALRIAKVFDVRVEDVFQLNGEA